MKPLRGIADDYLQRALANPSAQFHDGQWEAIEGLVAGRKRMLVVQATGWGKSMVYFLATRLLRDAGQGPTLIVSPLLALMRNQIAMGRRIGIEAETINSDNKTEWARVEERLLGDQVDVLLISPERLANEDFVSKVLSALRGRIGMLVVDEAHCISDWGHDFRPDYKRIVRVIRGLPAGVPVLATTATANGRVVDDVRAQIGDATEVLRGPLARRSLALQAIRLPSQAERLAWLAEHIPGLPGSGIVYVRTVRDAERVAAWLRQRGIDARPYYGGAPDRPALEDALLTNGIKALVSTSALGMGYDKPDLGFVVHFQRPGSVVEYYQQVGRAGRNGHPAYGIMLCGEEDDDITGYFIDRAFPPKWHIQQVIDCLDRADEPMSYPRIEAAVNLSRGQIEKVLKILAVQDRAPVANLGKKWYRTPNPYRYEALQVERLTAIRRQEQADLRAYMDSRMCHMAYLRRALDDVSNAQCGRCAVCVGFPLLSVEVQPDLVRDAIRFLRRSHQVIEARKQWPAGGKIAEAERCENGMALCIYGDAGWGQLVRAGKYPDRGQPSHFADELVEAAAAMVRAEWRPDPAPRWVTCVASLRHPALVPDFARRLAARLGLPFAEVIRKVVDRPEQKGQQNSAHQAANVEGAFAVVVPPAFRDQPVLLVDDMVDSRWTFAVLGAELRKKGSGQVFPLALAVTAGGSQND
jgi:ATP-dependent DNA helicase RecQ